MAKGINKVILIGALGNDPEIRTTQGGAVIASLSVATNDSIKDKASGEWQERTEWHKVVLFGKMAEVARDYLKKGSQVYIEGRLQTRKWQDKEGHDRYTTEIVGNDMQMLGGKRGDDKTQSTPPFQPPPTPPVYAPQPVAYSDDDIPF